MTGRKQNTQKKTHPRNTLTTRTHKIQLTHSLAHLKQAIQHGLAEYIQQFIDFEEVIPLWREWAQIVMAQVEKRVTEVARSNGRYICG